jgi:hypothetical protein
MINNIVIKIQSNQNIILLVYVNELLYKKIY